ncbi:MAG TPA: PA14 domain-containing protein [Planctomycetota bacterium]
MTRRKELEAAERRRSRFYETALTAGAVVVGASLLCAFGVVLYSLALTSAAADVPLADLQPGLLGRYGDGVTRVDARVEFEPGDHPFADHPAVEWTGFLRVPADGRYTFSVTGPAKLEIAGRPVNGAAELAAGHHALRLAYARGEGRPECRLSWESDARPREVVPAHSLFHVRGDQSARN